ncbi:MAG: DUF5671 domain-containing protein, partial [Chloroflexota bacterium]|nr:DUF5671 domain-containing protein [Chloroflexota bacterium]
MSAIVPLAVLGIMVAVVVLLVRRSRGGRKEAASVGLVRRLYYYGISFIALMVAASGATLLLSYAANRIHGPEWVVGGTNRLALGLALTIVGTPIWLVQWSFAQRAARRSPSEAQSLVRKVYIYLVLAVA